MAGLARGGVGPSLGWPGLGWAGAGWGWSCCPNLISIRSAMALQGLGIGGMVRLLPRVRGRAVQGRSLILRRAEPGYWSSSHQLVPRHSSIHIDFNVCRTTCAAEENVPMFAAMGTGEGLSQMSEPCWFARRVPVQRKSTGWRVRTTHIATIAPFLPTFSPLAIPHPSLQTQVAIACARL